MYIRARVILTARSSRSVTLQLCQTARLNMTGVFESAGLALAIPGIIDVIIRGGEVVYRKIETFRTKHETLIRYFGVSFDLFESILTFFAVSARQR